MSDSESPARKPPLPRRPLPVSPPQDYQHQLYSPIDYSQDFPPPPVYSPLPSIDSYEATGPEFGPDGHVRVESRNAVTGNNMSASSPAEEFGPGFQSPPAYTEKYGELEISQDGMETRAQVSEDGRVNININQKTKHLSSLFAPAMRGQLQLAKEAVERGKLSGKPPVPDFGVPEFAKNVPPLNILIQIIGSRGDVQPFIALGQVLRTHYRHRVRIATHPTFKEFVEENGLEFFSIGGDPAELMAFMVKNPGLMPGLDSLKSGDVGRRRKGMWEILLGCWRACIEPGDGTSNTPDLASGGLGNRLFIADAIIANPPSFGHIHCAEKLGVPLHLMFTMPWSPTTVFPHPLANIQSSNAESGVTNFLSYLLVDMMTWQGLGDLVNRFREKKLGLDPVSAMWAPGMISRLAVPHTYCWSGALIPKPLDWPTEISISGFYFLSLANSYTPPPDLARFLESGPPPVYIGFGSIVVDDPDALSELIFAAIRRVGVRALVSKGWGGLGAEILDIPPGVMMLGNCPHDWLFPRCSAVVHHGGAGTTAAGVRCGKPTVVVPFFGDQPFWGSMVAKAGAGPKPVPFKELTSEILAESIAIALSPDAQERAQELGAKITHENGAEVGAKTFLGGLAGEPGVGGIFRCIVDPNRPAVWRVRGTEENLSGFAASVLIANGDIKGGWQGLKLCRHKEWETDAGPYDPISGGAGALMGTIGSIMMGVGDIPKEMFRSVRKPVDGEAPRVEASSPARVSPGAQKGERSQNTSVGEGVITKKTAVSREASGSESAVQRKSDESAKRPGFGLDSIDLDMYMGTGKSVSKIVSAGLRSPMDFTLSLAQGFHNAPKLYGDDVRPTQKVTGFQSGLKAAGKGLSLGLYDGISGLVTQPIKGAKEEGAAGFLKGFGKGIGGIVFKGGAAVWGVPGYTMKGIHKEIQKLHASDVDKHIISSRITVSEAEYQQSSAQEQQAVLARWHELQLDSARKHAKKDIFSDDILRLRSGVKNKGKDNDLKGYVRASEPVIVSPIPRNVAHAYAPGVLQQVAAFDEEELENAIQESVKATSKGNPEEDRKIERAIRASVSELQNVAKNRPTENFDEDEEAFQRAIRASIAEANGGNGQKSRVEIGQETPKGVERPRGVGGAAGGSWLTDDPELEQALHESLIEQGASPRHADDGGLEQALRELDQALRESSRYRGHEPHEEKVVGKSKRYQKSPNAANLHEDNDEGLLSAIEESKRLDEEREAKIRAEEQAVMEYVLRASLEEQGYQRRSDRGGNSGSRV